MLLDEVSLKDRAKLLEVTDSLEIFLKDSHDSLNSIHKFCRSQLVFVDWVLENTRDFEEKQEPRKLIESINQ